jgi:hypothetical protein
MFPGSPGDGHLFLPYLTFAGKEKKGGCDENRRKTVGE